MIQHLRDRIPDLKWYTDKYVAVFLIARRHDLAGTEQLIQKFLEKRRECGFEYRPPRVSKDQEILELLRMRASARWPGLHDKYGRMISYFFMKHNLVDHPARASMTRWAFFEMEWAIECESLASHRAGMIWVMDFDDFSISKNIDTSPEFRRFSEEVQGVFPNRIRAIYIFNAGVFIKALLSVAKLMFPKKLSKRIQVIEQEELRSIIPRVSLLKQYGGEWELDFEKFLEEMKRGDRLVQQYWKSVRHQVRVEVRQNKKLEKEQRKATRQRSHTLPLPIPVATEGGDGGDGEGKKSRGGSSRRRRSSLSHSHRSSTSKRSSRSGSQRTGSAGSAGLTGHVDMETETTDSERLAVRIGSSRRNSVGSVDRNL